MSQGWATQGASPCRDAFLLFFRIDCSAVLGVATTTEFTRCNSFAVLCCECERAVWPGPHRAVVSTGVAPSTLSLSSDAAFPPPTSTLITDLVPRLFFVLKLRLILWLQNMDSTSSLEQQEEEIGEQIEQVSLSNNGSRPHANQLGSARQPKPNTTISADNKTTAPPPHVTVDSGAAQQAASIPGGEGGGGGGGGGGGDVEMSISSASPAPAPATTTAEEVSSPAAVETETGANGQQPPAGATPAEIPPGGLPPGMPAMDPFALLVQMSDRLIDESYQAASKDSETEPGVANKRPHSGAGAGGAGEDAMEPDVKVQKREQLAAAEPFSSKLRR